MLDVGWILAGLITGFLIGDWLRRQSMSMEIDALKARTEEIEELYAEAREILERAQKLD